MNRQAKRMMQRQKTTSQDRLESMQRRQRVMTQAERKKRTPPREFMKQVRGELKKVAWPTRRELLGYTAVVLVAVVFLTSLVFALDLGFSKAILHIFGRGPG
jgi:preprotein translocase subunit SecE